MKISVKFFCSCQTSRNMDRQLADNPSLDVSFSFSNELSVLFIYFPHNFLLSGNVLAAGYSDHRRRLLRTVLLTSGLRHESVPPTVLLASLRVSWKLLIPAISPSHTCDLIVSFCSVLWPLHLHILS